MRGICAYAVNTNVNRPPNDMTAARKHTHLLPKKNQIVPIMFFSTAAPGQQLLFLEECPYHQPA